MKVVERSGIHTRFLGGDRGSLRESSDNSESTHGGEKKFRNYLGLIEQGKDAAVFRISPGSGCFDRCHETG